MKAGARGDILDVRTWKTQKWWAVAFDLWLSIYWGSQRRSVQPDNPRGASRGGSLSSSASGIYGVGIFHGAIFCQQSWAIYSYKLEAKRSLVRNLPVKLI